MSRPPQVHETKNKRERKERIRENFGLDDGETTDEEASLEPDDVKQERLFFEGVSISSIAWPTLCSARVRQATITRLSSRRRRYRAELACP